MPVVLVVLVAGSGLGRVLELLQPHVQLLQVHHTLQRRVFGVHSHSRAMGGALHSRQRLTTDCRSQPLALAVRVSAAREREFSCCACCLPDGGAAHPTTLPQSVHCTDALSHLA